MLPSGSGKLALGLVPPTPDTVSAVRAYVELRSAGRADVIVLEGETMTVGRAASNSISLDFDRAVSKVHAAFALLPNVWCIRDLGSSNGTYVNGDRVVGERSLRNGDEVVVGNTRLTFFADDPSGLEDTTAAETPPLLTERERAVLVELCRPMFSGETFTEPAGNKEMAGHLFVSEGGVKYHLAQLYAKFEIPDGERSRRTKLANEAIRRRAVGLKDFPA